MTLRSVGGKDDRPLWERPYIPVSHSEEKLDISVAAKFSKAQVRAIDVICHQNTRPEIQTRSDFLRAAFYLLMDYYRRQPDASEELKKLGQFLELQRGIEARKDYQTRATSMLNDLEAELDACYNSHGEVVQPGDLRTAFQALEDARGLVPERLKPRANALWAKHRPNLPKS